MNIATFAANRSGRETPAVKRTRVAIFEPYIFDAKLTGNTRYLLCLFDHLDSDRFEPILISPVKDSFLNLIDELGGVIDNIEDTDLDHKQMADLLEILVREAG